MKTFRGGVHPPGNKEATLSKAVIQLQAPQEMIFPVSQHIGAPSVPCVKVGDTVLVGQKIAEAGGFVSANIHSSVSGKVKAIEKRLHPSGVYTEAVIIENDGLYTLSEEISDTERDYSGLSPKEIVDCVFDKGIVGMGGATFPTHVKLSPPEEAKIDYVIVNGAECEPYLTSDYRAMLENAEQIFKGIAIVLKIFGLKEGYMGVEDNKPDAIAHLKAEAENFKDAKIHVVALKTKYPQGAEKQLIKAITGRKIKPGQLPWQSGCVVANTDTFGAIYRAVAFGEPVIKRIVTTGGDAIKEPNNFMVRIGTPFSYVIEQSGGLTKEVGKVIMGGPMMGIAVPNTDVPVIKGSSGILALGKKASEIEEELPCLRCGKCVYVCPMKLQPNLLDMASRSSDYEKLEKLNIVDCIECGSCAFICPSKRRQVQQIKVAKIKMRDAQNKAK